MTTATLVSGNRTMDTAVARPRRSLEELVDQLMAAMFPARPAAVVVETTVAETATPTPTETAPQSVVRSVHEARRLRQAGDVDGALAVLGGMDAAKATAREARWVFSEWKQLVKRRFGDRERAGLQPGNGQGRRGGGPGRRRAAGGRGGPGDALAAGQAGLGAQPPGSAVPERGCVMVTVNVDIPTLKARHPLGDTVEASGVRLRGRGRVRQGVCPFHDEAEGSFTVYADSERWYCFGCGLGGDVLDFVRRVENLSLPEAIQRLDGSPGLPPGVVRRPAPTRRSTTAAVPPRDPALLTAASRFYAGELRRHPEAWEYLASRGVGLDAAARLGLGFSPGRGLREALESAGFTADRLRDSGLFLERGAERFAGMVVVPDPVSSTGQATGGLVRCLSDGPCTPT